MSIFSIHTAESAPAEVKPIFETGKKRYGFVPNLWGAMAEAPAALEAYIALGDSFNKTSLSNVERQVILLAVSAANGCTYCMAAHTFVAQMNKAPDDVITALRDRKPLSDARLQALRAFVEILIEKRGWADESEVQAFIGAGYNRRQVLEVILGITYKTLSNYTNHLVDTPVDEAFAKETWTAA